MLSPFELYLILQLDNICTLSITFLVLSIIFSIICFLVYFVNLDDPSWEKHMTRARQLFKLLLPICLFFSLCVAFIPNTKQAATIYLVPKVVNGIAESPEIQNTASDAFRILQLKVHQYLRETIDQSLKQENDTETKK